VIDQRGLDESVPKIQRFAEFTASLVSEIRGASVDSVAGDGLLQESCNHPREKNEET
jgi:hypothetical protein